MRAMVLEATGQPLVLRQAADPEPGPGEIRLRVEACGVCRTDLHVVDGELPDVALPVVPGHEVVGRVEALGAGVHRLGPDQRVGVPWLGSTCGACEYCLGGRENLCDAPGFTGYTRPGGFASHLVARADFCLPLPGEADPVATAPLLCAGLIGWRALCRTGQARALGIYGFGAAAHLLTQVARHQGRRVHAFTRPGDLEAQAFARAQGAAWAGDAGATAPEPLDAAIIFAPVGELVPLALQAVRKGGRVVCGGIHMSDIPAFPYRLLWEERELVSVANLTRADAHAFFAEAAAAGVRATTRRYRLEAANEALEDLRQGRLSGAAVLVP
ncbi:zinc-dependent alcohol dehydrogenase family protein [Frateuria soli]|uniref:zinc-dependent alcohol dehydrogenase family protein n=1 Tax=Frateuria soli TaxID=1542730 RepID=UPI001E548564|nr:zinc-dependent alcohol dehydrogenase family protein [Frateuria soli]UGB39609.1 zinc-dependent alcohol dehydrogenase family protein [Frateuria soli]